MGKELIFFTTDNGILNLHYFSARKTWKTSFPFFLFLSPYTNLYFLVKQCYTHSNLTYLLIFKICRIHVVQLVIISVFVLRCVGSFVSKISDGLLHLAFNFTMDKYFTKLLHIKIAYRVPHKWRHAFYRPTFSLAVPNFAVRISGVFAYIVASGDERWNY
jgi:hypothetical protein